MIFSGLDDEIETGLIPLESDHIKVSSKSEINLLSKFKIFKIFNFMFFYIFKEYLKN